MAKKKTDEFDFDESYDDGDFDFDGEMDDFLGDFDDGERKPKSLKDISVQAGKQLGDIGKYKDPRELDALMRESLPGSVSAEYTDISDTIQSTADLLSKEAADIKKSVGQVTKKIGAVVPNEGILRSIYNKVNNFIGEEDLEKEREKKLEDVRNEEINAKLDAILGGSEAINSLQQNIDNVLADKRSESTNTILTNILNNVSMMKALGRDFTVNYQRKSLELQMRQLYLTGDMLDTIKELGVKQNAQLDAIVKNTGLPDILKTRQVEFAKDELFRAGREKIRSSLFADDGVFGNIKKNIKNKITSITDVIKGSLDQADTMLDMVGGDSMMNPVDMAIDTGASMAHSTVTGRIMDKLLSTEKGGKFIRGLYRFHSDPSSWFANKATDMKNDGLVSKLMSKVFKFGADMTKVSPTKLTTTLNRENLDASTTLDGRMKASINKVIPSYLRKIHAEVKAQRLGFTKPDSSGFELYYDYNRDNFITKSSLAREIKAELKNTVMGKRTRVLDRYLDSKEFTKEEKDLAAKALSYSGSVSSDYGLNLIDNKYFKSVVGDELYNKINSKVINNSSHSINEDPDEYRQFLHALNSIRSTISDPASVINEYYNNGYIGILKENNLIKYDRSRNDYTLDGDGLLKKTFSYGGLDLQEIKEIIESNDPVAAMEKKVREIEAELRLAKKDTSLSRKAKNIKIKQLQKKLEITKKQLKELKDKYKQSRKNNDEITKEDLKKFFTKDIKEYKNKAKDKIDKVLDYKAGDGIDFIKSKARSAKIKTKKFLKDKNLTKKDAKKFLEEVGMDKETIDKFLKENNLTKEDLKLKAIKAKDKVLEKGGVVKDKLYVARDKAVNMAKATKEKIESIPAFQKVKGAMEDVLDKIENSSIYQNALEKKQVYKDYITDKYAELKSTIGDKLEKLKNTKAYIKADIARKKAMEYKIVKDTTDKFMKANTKIKAIIKEVKDSVKKEGYIKTAKDKAFNMDNYLKAKNKAIEIKDKALGYKDKAKSKIMEKYEEAKEFLKKHEDTIRNSTLRSTAKSLYDNRENIYDTIKDKAVAGGNYLKSKVSTLKDKASEEFKQKSKEMRDEYRKTKRRQETEERHRIKLETLKQINNAVELSSMDVLEGIIDSTPKEVLRYVAVQRSIRDAKASIEEKNKGKSKFRLSMENMMRFLNKQADATMADKESEPEEKQSMLYRLIEFAAKGSVTAGVKGIELTHNLISRFIKFGWRTEAKIYGGLFKKLFNIRFLLPYRTRVMMSRLLPKHLRKQFIGKKKPHILKRIGKTGLNIAGNILYGGGKLAGGITKVLGGHLSDYGFNILNTGNRIKDWWTIGNAAEREALNAQRVDNYKRNKKLVTGAIDGATNSLRFLKRAGDLSFGLPGFLGGMYQDIKSGEFKEKHKDKLKIKDRGKELLDKLDRLISKKEKQEDVVEEVTPTKRKRGRPRKTDTVNSKRSAAVIEENSGESRLKKLKDRKKIVNGVEEGSEPSKLLKAAKSGGSFLATLSKLISPLILGITSLTGFLSKKLLGIVGSIGFNIVKSVSKGIFRGFKEAIPAILKMIPGAGAISSAIAGGASFIKNIGSKTGEILGAGFKKVSNAVKAGGAKVAEFIKNLKGCVPKVKSQVVKKLGKNAGGKVLKSLLPRITSRLIPGVSLALLTYDIGMVSKYMISDNLSFQSAVSKQLLGFDLWDDNQPVLDDRGEPVKPDDELLTSASVKDVTALENPDSTISTEIQDRTNLSMETSTTNINKPIVDRTNTPLPRNNTQDLSMAISSGFKNIKMPNTVLDTKALESNQKETTTGIKEMVSMQQATNSNLEKLIALMQANNTKQQNTANKVETPIPDPKINLQRRIY